MSRELYKKYRPRSLNHMIGIDDTIGAFLQGIIEKENVPHCMLFVGPSGCGKTTTIRILARSIGCSRNDYNEMNCASDARGIDAIREIQQRMMYSPLGGKVRVWALDECHRLTADAQSALLKTLEDTPSHVYFFLATTDPHKLANTIRTRATEVRFSSLTDANLKQLLAETSKDEGFELTDDVSEAIRESADGSARKAMVLLNVVVGIIGENKQLEAIHADAKGQTIELCRALIEELSWKQVSKLLKEIKDVQQEPERVRRAVLGYCASTLLGAGQKSPRAAEVIDVFQDDLYSSGKAGLVAMCFEVSKLGNAF